MSISLSVRRGWPVTRVAVPVGLSGLAAFVFTRAQDQLGRNRGTDRGDARYLIRVERLLHIDVEPTATRWLSTHPHLAYGAGLLYELALLLPWVAIVVAGVRDAALTRRALASLFLFTTLSLVPFWLFPTAPPRFGEPGVVDIVTRFRVFATETHSTESAIDVDASMPSLHVAWAWWCAAVLWRVPRRPGDLPRWTVWLIPAAVAVVVVVTGNHYLLDVAAGAALAAGGNAVFLREQRAELRTG